MLEGKIMFQRSKLRILSAGAPKTGVRLCAEFYSAATGNPFEIEFATAPAICERATAGNANADVIIVPVKALEEFENDGTVVAGSSVPLGSVSAGVAVRNGAWEPDLSSAEEFRQALLAADVLIYNRASSGQHIESLIDDFGLTKEVVEKTVRTDTGAGAMEHLAGDRSERAIGFGQITEIRSQEDLGILLVGSLPEEVNLKTSYCAGLSSTAEKTAEAKALLTHFASQEGQCILFESGLECG
ncbi:MAG: substrate-binding domain-containing protein [Rhizobiaceae bacterium]